MMDEAAEPPATESQTLYEDMDSAISQSRSTTSSSTSGQLSQDSAEGTNITESQATTQSMQENGSSTASQSVEPEGISAFEIMRGNPEQSEWAPCVESSARAVDSGMAGQADFSVHNDPEIKNLSFQTAESVALDAPQIENVNSAAVDNVVQAAFTPANVSEPVGNAATPDDSVQRDGEEPLDEHSRDGHMDALGGNAILNAFSKDHQEPLQLSKEAMAPLPHNDGQRESPDLSDKRIEDVLDDERWLENMGIELPFDESSMDIDGPVTSDAVLNGTAHSVNLEPPMAISSPDISTGERHLVFVEDNKFALESANSMPRGNSPDYSPQKVKVKPSPEGFRTPLARGANQTVESKDGHYSIDLEEDTLFIPKNKASHVIDLDGSEDGHEDDEDVEVVSRTPKVNMIKHGSDKDGDFKTITKQAPADHFRNHRDVQPEIANEFLQSKPNTTRKSAQDLKKIDSSNPQFDILSDENLLEQNGEDSDDAVMFDPRNPASKKHRKKAKAEAKSAKKKSKTRNISDSDGSDYDATENDEEEDDGSYERQDHSSKKRKRKTNDPGNSRKNRKTTDAKTGIRRARNAPEWHALNRLRPTYKLRDTAWKREQIENCGLVSKKPKKKKRGKPQNVDISGLLPGHTAFHHFMNDNQDKDDFHKLKNKDLNLLKEDARSFGYDRMKLVTTARENGEIVTTWKMKEMETGKFLKPSAAVLYSNTRQLYMMLS